MSDDYKPIPELKPIPEYEAVTVTVLGADGKALAPTKLDRALSMLRQGKAKPVVIQLVKKGD